MVDFKESVPNFQIPHLQKLEFLELYKLKNGIFQNYLLNS